MELGNRTLKWNLEAVKHSSRPSLVSSQISWSWMHWIQIVGFPFESSRLKSNPESTANFLMSTLFVRDSGISSAAEPY